MRFYTSLNADISGTRKDIKERSTVFFPVFPVLSYQKKNFHFISTLINRIRQINVCCHGYRFTMATKISTTSISNTVYVPILNLIAFIVIELFTIISWKCRHFTPEPRFQTANQETRIRANIDQGFTRAFFMGLLL